MKKFLVVWSTLKVKAYLGLRKRHEVHMTSEFSAELAIYTVQLHGVGEQFQNSNLDASTELNLRSLYHSLHGYSIVWSYLDLPTCCVCLGISLKHSSPEPLQVKTRRYTSMHMHGCMHACTHKQPPPHLQRHPCVMEFICMVGCQNSIVMNGLSSKRAPC